jgi:hypothetical protein
MMGASRKQVAHLLTGIGLVQQVVWDDEARSVGVIKLLRYAHVKTYVSGQVLTRRDRVPLAITPDSATLKLTFGAERVEVLQQLYAKRCLTRPARSVH